MLYEGVTMLTRGAPVGFISRLCGKPLASAMRRDSAATASVACFPQFSVASYRIPAHNRSCERRALSAYSRQCFDADVPLRLVPQVQEKRPGRPRRNSAAPPDYREGGRTLLRDRGT